MKVLYLFGPNLGALGRREPDKYGTATLEQIMSEVAERAPGHEARMPPWCGRMSRG